METVHCHSSLTFGLLMGVVICEKVLPQSAVRFVKIGFLSGCSFIRTFGCQVLTNIITSPNTDVRKDCLKAIVWFLCFQHRH